MLKGNKDLKYALMLYEDVINEKSSDSENERYATLLKVKSFVDNTLNEEKDLNGKTKICDT